MPGFDRTGPEGMGPTTGGARGFCNHYGRSFGWTSFDPRSGGARGRGRGYRHMYWATGLPGWMRVGKEQEATFLKDREAILKEELDAIDKRIRDLETEGKTE